MGRFNHERLRCYAMAVAVARWMGKAAWPTGSAELKEQGLRAAQSVVLNLAEGVSRGGAAGRNQLRIAMASAAEACAVLDLVDIGGADQQQEALRRVAAMIVALP